MNVGINLDKSAVIKNLILGHRVCVYVISSVAR